MTLKPFQLTGARRIYELQGRALLADAPGLGKTLQALYWVTKIPRRRPVIIVTPASMKYVWQLEASDHFNLRTEVLEGKDSGRTILSRDDIYIINYDILSSWLRELTRLQPACVILDEIHYCKSLRAKRTKAVLELTRDVPSVIGLSGTPLVNRPIELWPALHMIRPDLFPSVRHYAWRYCSPRWTPWGWKYDGAKDLHILNRLLKKSCMIRRLKKDVLSELPDKTRQVIPFRLPDRREYDQAEQDFLTWLRSISPARALRAAKSAALTRVGYLLRLVARLKLERSKEWISDYLESSPEKLIAFTRHTFVIDNLYQEFGPQLSVILDGRVTGRWREEVRRAFQTNKRIRLLLGNLQAAGTGITLTAAWRIVFLDLPWTPGDLLQGEDRVHRIGQKHPVQIHYLVAIDTIEEKLMAILKRKASILDAVLDGKAQSHDLDVFDELLGSLRGKK
jgi:SWI/SNF-related matrix-associated actin-dependent regulator 1 of chromatin subfamily A